MWKNNVKKSWTSHRLSCPRIMIIVQHWPLLAPTNTNWTPWPKHSKTHNDQMRCSNWVFSTRLNIYFIIYFTSSKGNSWLCRQEEEGLGGGRKGRGDKTWRLEWNLLMRNWTELWKGWQQIYDKTKKYMFTTRKTHWRRLQDYWLEHRIIIILPLFSVYCPSTMWPDQCGFCLFHSDCWTWPERKQACKNYGWMSISQPILINRIYVKEKKNM